MARDWESTFTSWGNGPSKTEQDKAANAERQVRDAISASSKLNNRKIRVFAQGSYRNRVNVRQDSDVDIGVACSDVFFPDYSDDNVKDLVEAGLIDGSYSFATFKNEVGEALTARFGSGSVSRGDKSFDVKANTYRVEADVAPFFEHRRYTSATGCLYGVEMIPDSRIPSKIINWPEQHYSNGVDKNQATSRRFKRAVRMLKKLSNEMAENGVPEGNIPSFLIECMVWNVPNTDLMFGSNMQMVRSALAHIYQSTLTENDCSDWGEVSELKYLFRGPQPWTRAQANAFTHAAWNYVGYK
jgi:hypothetical protein